MMKLQSKFKAKQNIRGCQGSMAAVPSLVPGDPQAARGVQQHPPTPRSLGGSRGSGGAGETPGLSPPWRKRSLEQAGAKAGMHQAKAVAVKASQPSPKSQPRATA